MVPAGSQVPARPWGSTASEQLQGECWVGQGRLGNNEHSHSFPRAGGSPTYLHCAGGQGLLSLPALENGFGALSKFFCGTGTQVLPQASVQET